MSEMKALPAWPTEKPEHLGLANSVYWEAYERARAEAALARLRVAVEELNRQSGHLDCEDCWYSCARLTCDERRKSDVCDCGATRVQDLISTIGDIP